MFSLNSHDFRPQKTFHLGTVEFQIIHAPENMPHDTVGGKGKAFGGVESFDFPGDFGVRGHIADFAHHGFVVQLHFVE